MKAYNKQQDEIQHIKKYVSCRPSCLLSLNMLHRFIASAGTYANLVRQAKSKQKILDKMEAAGLIEKIEARKSSGHSFLGIANISSSIFNSKATPF